MPIRVSIQKIILIFRSVYDIDLYVAGLLENPVNQAGPTVGPTFAYMITQQFNVLKTGDRFFYEKFYIERSIEWLIYGEPKVIYKFVNILVGD